MQAYAPLSWKLFGFALVQTWYKLLFAKTLLFTKLFFGVYVLVLTPRQLEHFNCTYIVILQCIADEPRY